MSQSRLIYPNVSYYLVGQSDNSVYVVSHQQVCDDSIVGCDRFFILSSTVRRQTSPRFNSNKRKPGSRIIEEAKQRCFGEVLTRHMRAQI